MENRTPGFNICRYGKWAGLASTGLPGPLKAMKKKFFGVFSIVPHMKRYQTAHKVELVPAGGIYLYNWQNVYYRRFLGKYAKFRQQIWADRQGINPRDKNQKQANFCSQVVG